jgi:hypothetical protein
MQRTYSQFNEDSTTASDNDQPSKKQRISHQDGRMKMFVFEHTAPSITPQDILSSGTYVIEKFESIKNCLFNTMDQTDNCEIEAVSIHSLEYNINT